MRSHFIALVLVAGAATAVRAAPSASIITDEEAALARAADPTLIVRLALARSPDVREVRERAGATEERAHASAGLPDLEFKYEQWGVPLARPYALDEAGTIMAGLRQTFPAPGSRAARERAGLEDARSTMESLRARQLDIRRSVRRALAEYYRADREYRIHLEHVTIATHLVEIARSHYRAGQGTQQDVLRAIVELSRLHTDVADIEQQRDSARALLNAMMVRAPDAPLGPAPEPTPADVAMATSVDDKRPELASAAHAIARSEALLEGARSEAYWPSVMVGADYWYMPADPKTQHAYGAMVSFNLPWLSRRRWQEVSAAEHEVAAERSALDAARVAVGYELRDAELKVKAARDAFTILDRDLMAEARQSYEAAEAAYGAGGGDVLGVLDALRSYLQVRLDRNRTLARLEASLADLERAVGAEGNTL